MRRALRVALNLLSALAAGAALLAAAAVVLVVALSRGFERERVTRFVAERVGAALDAEVRVGRLEGALVNGFRAEEIELRAGAGPPLAAEALELRFDPSPLWRERRLAITRVRLEGLRAALAREADGSWRVSGIVRRFAAPDEGKAPAPAPEAAPVLRAVTVGELIVRDARVALGAADAPAATRTEDAPAPTRLEVGLDAEATDIAWEPGVPQRLPATLDARATLTPSTIAGRTVERGALSLRVEGARIAIPSAELAGPFGTITVPDAHAALAEAALPLRPTALDARARVEALDLGALLDEPRLASRLAGDIELRFTPDDPARPEHGVLAAELALGSAPIAGLAIDTIEARGALHTATRAFALEAARVAGEAGVVELTGAGDAHALEALALRADLRVDRLPEAWRGPLAAGRLRAEARAQGPWRDPRGTLTAEIEALQLGARGPGRFVLRVEAPGERRLRADELALALPDLAIRNTEPVRLRIAGEAVAVESLALAGPGVHASTRGRVAADAFDGLRIELDAGDLAALAAAAGLGAPLAGRLAGWVQADGPLGAPALRGELAAAPLALGDTEVDRIELALRTEAARVRATARVLDSGQPRMRAEASAARAALFAAPGTLLERTDSELRVIADALELAWLARLTGLTGPGDEPLPGRLDADVRVAGARAAPRATGFVRVRDGRIPAPLVAEPLGPVTADLRFEGDALRVERLHVAGYEGEMRGSGRLRWGAAAPARADTDLRLVFDAFTLPPGGTVAGRLVGALALAGAWPQLALTGRVAMDPGRFRAPQASAPAWREIRVHGLEGEPPGPPLAAPGEPPPPLPGPLERSRVDLVLAVEEGSRFVGQGADLDIAGQVNLRKEPDADPIFSGSIRTTRGFYVFRGRRFEVERGVATLAGTRELDPELDVVASQEIGEVTLRVVVSGRASAPVVTLESDPPLDATDQLSYLAFGRPASALGASDAARLESAATQVLGELLLQSGVAATLFERLPLGRLSLSTGGAGASGLSVGAELWRGIRVFYARDLGYGESGARIQWRFHRNWMLQSELDEDGDTTADVIWSFEF